jgi:hypothetical protein
MELNKEYLDAYIPVDVYKELLETNNNKNKLTLIFNICFDGDNLIPVLHTYIDNNKEYYIDKDMNLNEWTTAELPFIFNRDKPFPSDGFYTMKDCFILNDMFTARHIYFYKKMTHKNICLIV